MASPTLHYPGAVYHVMLRGNRKQEIFYQPADYRGFETRLTKSLHVHEARCHAFCWMPNHVHLVIQVSSTPVHRVLHHLATTYAGWFNRKYGLVGHLFQGRYVASHVADDSYLVQVARYIHLNPVTAGIVARPEEYAWSSYQPYFQGVSCGFLTTSVMLSMFGTEHDRASQMFLEFHGHADDYVPPWNPSPDEFTDGARSQSAGPSLEDLIAEAARRFETTDRRLSGSARDRATTNARLWVAREALDSGCATRSDVARRLGRTPQAISQMLQRAQLGER